MLAKVLSGAIVGLESVPVTVEVDIASKALPAFTIVGLPGKAVEESKERVRSAIKNSGAEFPARRITVNLAPADLPKNGPSYDLPIALGILLASGQIPKKDLSGLFVGELSLDGSVCATNGVLSLATLAKTKKINNIFVPIANVKEAAIIEGIDVFPVKSLISLFHHLSKTALIPIHPHISFEELHYKYTYDFDMRDIHGQEHVKRALEIAAAGGHNMYMHGPPGAGKTMLARTFPSILPSLTEEESLEVTNIYSITGSLPNDVSVVTERPFRAPHHTTSRIGLIGGGRHPNPGEISLAHRGILFLDEFPEFPRNVLEALRQPLEDGIVTISRASGSVTYPAKFMLIAAANPCPCGNYNSDNKVCTCPSNIISRYQKRISGPILDRIDLHVSVPAVKVEQLTSIDDGNRESSKVIQKRVQLARNFQLKRLKEFKIQSNAEMTTKIVKKKCNLSTDVSQFLKQAVTKLHLSARSYYRVIKVSRTIADLEREKDILVLHVAEALQYRPKEY
ncbi:YifB family Mg chelatase-like AAA ATPase [Patescibacteria group bacterium]